MGSSVKTAPKAKFGSLAMIGIKGFRRLRDVDVPLEPLNVLIGANGVGKSSFLDALQLIAASADGRLDSCLAEFGGIGSILTLDTETSLELRVQTSEEKPLIYAMELDRQGHGYRIVEEHLEQDNRKGQSNFKHIQRSGSNLMYYNTETRKLERPTWSYNSLDSALSQVPRMFEEPEAFRQRLASIAYYHFLDVRTKAPIRTPQQMRPASLPGANGEDLVSCLYTARETDANRFEVICDSLKAVFSDFERLDFPPVAAGTLAMTWKDRFSRPLYMHQLSEGTLRFLWLTALLTSSELPAITLIDEPEVGLHPEMLSMLADLLREASVRTQLVVATHSDRLVSFLKKDEVLVMDQEDGYANLTRANSLPNLQDWLSDYSLGELWQKGILGGRS